MGKNRNFLYFTNKSIFKSGYIYLYVTEDPFLQIRGSVERKNQKQRNSITDKYPFPNPPIYLE